jgi:hypothetical protein
MDKTACVPGSRREFSGEDAEQLLLRFYTGLPLLDEAADGSRSATLVRLGQFEVRLTEFPLDRMPIVPLWVDLFDCERRKLLDARGFSELEDGFEAVRELVVEARSRHERGAGTTPI